MPVNWLSLVVICTAPRCGGGRALAWVLDSGQGRQSLVCEHGPRFWWAGALLKNVS